MTSRIRLYNIPGMTEENNYVVESFSDFISHFTPVYDLENFQFQRLESSKTIKINRNQGIAGPGSNQINYCSIVTTRPGSTVTYSNYAYYFVQEVRQIDENTVLLAMKLDVLNTFFNEWKNKMTSGTFIARGHEKRFVVHSSDASSLTLASIFNRRPEGDNPPLLSHRTKTETIYDASLPRVHEDVKFYLIYRTSNDGRPCVDLAASKQLQIGAGSTGSPYVLDGSQMVEGRYYYLIGDIRFTISGSEQFYTTAGGGGLWSGWYNSSRSYNGSGFLVFWLSGSDYICFKFISGADDVNAENGSFYELQNMPDLTENDKHFRTVKDDDSTGSISIELGKTLYYSPTITYDQEEIKTFQSIEINAGTFAEEYLGDLPLLDKTDSKIVKVIECPYCPVDFSYDEDSGVFSFDRQAFPNESENENPHYLRTYDIGREFGPKFLKQLDFTDLAFQPVQKQEIANPTEHFLADPKIYTSPYYAVTFYYDNFAKAIKMEDYAYTRSVGRNNFRIALDYKQSNAVSSAMAFSFSATSAFNAYRLSVSEENFPNYLVANRNNEVTLFSSDYLNYMRNGYNYDKKKMEEQLQQQGVSAGIQAISSIISFLLSPATGGLSAAAGVGLAAGAVSSASSLAYSTTKAGEELSQKVNLLKAQGFSVSSVDDLSLFNHYQGNKLKKTVYELEEDEYSRVDARFRYFGYAVDKYGNPADFYMSSRHAYNYIKADPVFNQDATYIVTPEYLDEISEKIRAGITIWHLPFLVANSYIFDKDVENIEEDIFQAAQ